MSGVAGEALRAVAEELYGLAPEEFTAARTRAERAARADGDRELAAAVKGLRKPVVAAWAANQLVRHRRELVEQVVALGASLREAQAQLQGEQLRELTRQRRRLVGAVTAEARALAASLGQRLAEPAAREVEETLTAAMADPVAAEALLSGVLTQPLSSTGVESLSGDVGAALGVPLPATGVAAGAATGVATGAAAGSAAGLRVVPDAGRARREAEERAEAARAAVAAAEKRAGSLRRKRAKAEARVLQLEAELDELRRRLADLEAVAEEAAGRVEELDQALAEADAGLEEAQAEADAAARALEST